MRYIEMWSNIKQNYTVVLLNNFSCEGSVRGISVVRTTGKFLARLWNDESGVSAVEYVLLLALVGSTLIIGASFLGLEVGLQLNETATCLQAGITCVP